ncbi:hypothetical protein [Methylovulum miyakonense]|uniref:hypothetical protein n=1 Tax=Methylovulum miyakonense TaxID=645578 RepID=UPI0012EB55FB|nr:hypothetical protein [Methylovulum miyakonense]
MPKFNEMNELINSIKSAFGWRSRPAILSNSKQLSSGDKSDLLTIGNLKWEEVTCEDWEKNFDVISLFSPEAFCYYLPGVYKASIEENLANLIVVSNIIDSLDRSPTPEWWDDWFLKRWPLLTLPEYKVTQDWIWWLSSFKNSQFSDDSLMRALHTIELLSKNQRGQT